MSDIPHDAEGAAAAPSSGGPVDAVHGAAEWQHLHPLSPLLRGGVAFLAALTYVVSQQMDRIFGASPDDPTQGHGVLVLGGAGIVLALIITGAWVSWRFSRFRVGTSMLELRTGLLFRQHRQVRFDRIQAVDISRPILARLTGLSEVIVQSAGGRDSNVKLAFLTDERAREVREQLMALAGPSDEAPSRAAGPDDIERAPTAPPAWSHSGPPSGPHAGPPYAGPHLGWGPSASAAVPVAESVVRVPNARLVQSALYSGTTIFLVLAVPVLATAIAFRIPGVVAWLGPLTLGVGWRHLQGLVRNANFELLHQGDSLRIRHGLVDLRTTSVPLHRVQAAELDQPLMWRLPSWWRLRVNVAGAGDSDEHTQTLLMPVGTLHEALVVLALVRPGIPAGLATAAMLGEGPDGGFVTAPERARSLDPLSWRRRGYAVSPAGVVVRGGWAQHLVQVVPHARIQSLRLEQGPLQRRRDLATVRLVSTPGPVKPEVAHLDTKDAMRLLNEQVARSSHARRRM